MPYFRVTPKIWLEPWSEDARILALYLLTCEHRTTEGFFRLPKAYMCADLHWLAERLSKPFKELLDDGFLYYDDAAEVVLIVKALAYQRPDNENQQTAAIRSLRKLPQTRLWPAFKASVEAFAKPFGQALTKAFPQEYAQALPEGMGDSHCSLLIAPSPEEEEDIAPDGAADYAEFGEAPLLKSGQATISADAKRLAARAYDHQKAIDGLPPDKSRYFWQQARYAQDKLLPARPCTEWLAAWEWGETRDYWRSQLTRLNVLERVWLDYAAWKAKEARAAPACPPPTSLPPVRRDPEAQRLIDEYQREVDARGSASAESGG